MNKNSEHTCYMQSSKYCKKCQEGNMPTYQNKEYLLKVKNKIEKYSNLPYEIINYIVIDFLDPRFKCQKCLNRADIFICSE